MDDAVILTIVGMAVATYATRASGPWFGERIRTSPRSEAALATLPGAILVSLVAPAVVSGGLPGIIAAIATLLVAARTRGNIWLPMLAGTALIALMRLI